MTAKVDTDSTGSFLGINLNDQKPGGINKNANVTDDQEPKEMFTNTNVTDSFFSLILVTVTR